MPRSSRYNAYDPLAEVYNRHWVRDDVALEQRCYPEAAVRAALTGAGFAEVTAYDAGRDLGLNEVGRMFFRARKARA